MRQDYNCLNIKGWANVFNSLRKEDVTSELYQRYSRTLSQSTRALTQLYCDYERDITYEKVVSDDLDCLANYKLKYLFSYTGGRAHGNYTLNRDVAIMLYAVNFELFASVLGLSWQWYDYSMKGVPIPYGDFIVDRKPAIMGNMQCINLSIQFDTLCIYGIRPIKNLIQYRYAKDKELIYLGTYKNTYCFRIIEIVDNGSEDDLF